MIDLITEEVITLAVAAKLALLPARRQGKRPHVSCLHRWATKGCRGEILETIQVGGTRCTSVEALQRFFNRLSEKAGTAQTSIAGGRTCEQRRRASESADSKLRKMGS